MSGRSEGGSTRTAYIVVEHLDVGRVLELASGLRARSASCLPLVAFNGPLSDEDASRLREQGVVRVGSGRPAQWGQFSLVRRGLEALQDALALEWDWVVLVSGQDYPVGALGEWERGLRTGGTQAVSAGRAVAADDLELVQRYTFAWYRVPWIRHPRGLGHRAVVRALTEVSTVASWITFRVDGTAVFVGVRRPGATADGLYKGEFWVALSRPAVQTVVASDEARVLRRRLRRSLFPDEAFVPSVLRQAAVPVRDALVTQTLWSPDDPAHPRLLAAEDLPVLEASGVPFARKFAGPGRPQLLSWLDERARRALEGGPQPSSEGDAGSAAPASPV